MLGCFGHTVQTEGAKQQDAGCRTWVLCSWRGLASLPSRPMGELMRRKWDRVDAKVSLFSTCTRNSAALASRPQHRQGTICTAVPGPLRSLHRCRQP